MKQLYKHAYVRPVTEVFAMRMTQFLMASLPEGEGGIDQGDARAKQYGFDDVEQIGSDEDFSLWDD